MTENEFEIIERYFKVICKTSEGVVLGSGDDCAVLAFANDNEVCVSTDTFIEGVHFPEGCSASMVASRLVGANLSDLAAMGADPHSCLIALTIPDAKSNWLSEFSMTLGQLLDHYGLVLVGGNISKGTLSLTMTVLGSTPVGQALTRSGAEPLDQIYVSGTLGDAWHGLNTVLSEEKPLGNLSSRYVSPTPRLEIGRKLRGLASAMIDVSDGLISDLTHICRSSKVGATVDLASIPVSYDLVNSLGDLQARLVALTAGDDYELCFTAPETLSKQLSSFSDTSGVSIKAIGRIRMDPGVDVLDSEGNRIELDNLGYSHF